MKKEKIMLLEDANQAAREIYWLGWKTDLSVVETDRLMEEYAKLHNISVEEMCTDLTTGMQVYATLSDYKSLDETV